MFGLEDEEREALGDGGCYQGSAGQNIDTAYVATEKLECNH